VTQQTDENPIVHGDESMGYPEREGFVSVHGEALG
jgi:hypothetical protein